MTSYEFVSVLCVGETQLGALIKGGKNPDDYFVVGAKKLLQLKTAAPDVATKREIGEALKALRIAKAEVRGNKDSLGNYPPVSAFYAEEEGKRPTKTAKAVQTAPGVNPAG